MTAGIIKSQLTKKVKTRKPIAIREKMIILGLGFIFIFAF